MIRVSRVTSSRLALLAFALLAGEASAAPLQPAGSVVGYTAAGFVTGGDGRQAADVGFPLYMGDRLETGATGQLQIVFADATRLVVGPNAAMTVDDYVFNANGTASTFTLTATRGAFRFISGQSAKPVYAIRTPTASLGLRGTAFDLSVAPNGDTGLALFIGAAQLCGVDQRCTIVDTACSVAVTGLNSVTRAVTSLPERIERLREAFPYVVSQAALRQDFQLPTGTCGDIRAALVPAANDPAFAPAARGGGAVVPPGPPQPPVVPIGPGNPGNGGPNGNAGANPGGNDMGEPGRGRSDDNAGHGGGNDHGNNGGGNDHGNNGGGNGGGHGKG